MPAAGWDRWDIRRIYATGGDGGLFVDLVDKAEPFSVRIEECFSIGRAFGGGVANVLSRSGEPSVFRNCTLWCLDWDRNSCPISSEYAISELGSNKCFGEFFHSFFELCQLPCLTCC